MKVWINKVLTKSLPDCWKQLVSHPFVSSNELSGGFFIYCCTRELLRDKVIYAEGLSQGHGLNEDLMFPLSLELDCVNPLFGLVDFASLEPKCSDFCAALQLET